MRFIRTSNLKPGMVLARDIINKNSSFLLKKGVTLNAKYISYLDIKGYIGAYIFDPDSEDIDLEDSISAFTREEGIDAVENKDIERVINTAQQMVAEILSRKHINMDVLDLRSYDDYTYHHSVNVAVYATAIGKAMGLTELQLIQLCQAGLCHDMGKQSIPEEILNKPGALTDAELETVRNHPQASYDIIYDNPEITAPVRQAVLTHHENENGSGYPKGLDGNQLNIISKIIHAADVYDALISKRPYKEPYSPADAMEYLMGGRSILFNDAVVDAMCKVIPSYPSATEVILSNGEHALVVRQTGDPTRPIVKVLGSKEYINLSQDNRNLSIVASGILEPDYSREVEKLNDARHNVREKKPTVMLVDDSLMNLQQTSQALAPDGYEIIALQSGLAALNYIRDKGAPDLIVMDIMMPTVDGISTVSSIRKLGYTDLPVIFLTAKGDRETIMKCILVQAKDYIIKPVRPVYLRGRVARALNESLER
ncbi:MAG: response regulator [Lachnospiraceae bacterium]|nr:response regulator [Lachnospiraceae bacterium]